MNTVGSHSTDNSLDTVNTYNVPARATHIVIGATSQNVRITLDGTAPSTTIGFLIKAGEEPVMLPVENQGAVKAIEVASAATVNYQFISLAG